MASFSPSHVFKPPLGPEVRFDLYCSHRNTQQPGALLRE
jgi:hypothetical protein